MKREYLSFGGVRFIPSWCIREFMPDEWAEIKKRLEVRYRLQYENRMGGFLCHLRCVPREAIIVT